MRTANRPFARLNVGRKSRQARRNREAFWAMAGNVALGFAATCAAVSAIGLFAVYGHYMANFY